MSFTRSTASSNPDTCLLRSFNGIPDGSLVEFEAGVNWLGTGGIKVDKTYSGKLDMGNNGIVGVLDDFGNTRGCYGLNSTSWLKNIRLQKEDLWGSNVASSNII